MTETRRRLPAARIATKTIVGAADEGKTSPQLGERSAIAPEYTAARGEADDERHPQRELRRRRHRRPDRVEVDVRDRPRPLRRAAPLHAARARVPRDQPAHALGAAADAGARGDRDPTQLPRVAAARRVRADAEGARAAPDRERDAQVRPLVARRGAARRLARNRRLRALSLVRPPPRGNESPRPA